MRMKKLLSISLLALLLVFPVLGHAAPCWMKPAAQQTLPCHKSTKSAEPCQHLTVADCAAPQMSAADAPHMAKAQMVGVEYTLPMLQPQPSRVLPLMVFMSQAPPETSRQLLSILLTTQRYLI